MEASTTFRGSRLSRKGVGTVVAALVASLLLGGVGGYVIRAVGNAQLPSVMTNAQTQAPPAVVPPQSLLPDWAYRDPNQPTMPWQTTDPNGNVINI